MNSSSTQMLIQMFGTVSIEVFWCKNFQVTLVKKKWKHFKAEKKQFLKIKV